MSTDELKSFKPNPDVYHHFLKRSGVSANNAWLISNNSFDVIGTICSGMQAAWVKRSAEVIFDSWGIEPTLTVESLKQLHSQIS